MTTLLLCISSVVAAVVFCFVMHLKLSISEFQMDIDTLTAENLALQFNLKQACGVIERQGDTIQQMRDSNEPEDASGSEVADVSEVEYLERLYSLQDPRA